MHVYITLFFCFVLFHPLHEKTHGCSFCLLPLSYLPIQQRLGAGRSIHSDKPNSRGAVRCGSKAASGVPGIGKCNVSQ